MPAGNVIRSTPLYPMKPEQDVFKTQFNPGHQCESELFFVSARHAFPAKQQSTTGVMTQVVSSSNAPLH